MAPQRSHGHNIIRFNSKSLLLAGALMLVASAARADDGPVPKVAATVSASPAATQPSTLASTQPATAPVELTSRGYFQPIDPFEVRIRPKVYGGELAVVSVAANGATVKPNDVLLELDPKPLQKQLAAAQNELAVAKANLEKVESDAKLNEQINALALRQQQDYLRQSTDNLKWWETVDGPQMLQETDLQLKRSKANVDDQQDELDQLKKMYKSDELTNATADIVVKRAVRNLEVSQKEMGMFEQRAEKTKTFSYPIERQKALDSVQSATFSLEQLEIAQKQAKVATEAGLFTAKTAADDAQKKVSDLESDLAALTVRAPSDGIVAYGAFLQGAFQGDPKMLRVGEKVAAQQVLMTVYASGKLSVLVNLPEKTFAAIKPGQRATIGSDAYADLKLHGVVEAGPRTPSASGAAPTYSTTIHVDDVDARLVPGNAAEVTFLPASSNGISAAGEK